MRRRQEKNNNNQNPNFYRPSWRIAESPCLASKIKELLLTTVGVVSAGGCEILATHWSGLQLIEFLGVAPVREAINKVVL